VSGEVFRAFGGHTSCVEILTAENQIIIDAGTGFQTVHLCDDRPILVLFSHFHHDHIQGLAFNDSLFSAPRNVSFASALCSADTLYATLRRYFGAPFYPADFGHFLTPERCVDFGDLTGGAASGLGLESVLLNHPGGCAGYSISAVGRKLSYLLDNEFQPDQAPSLRIFTDEADLVIWDGMFLDCEMPGRLGWGHSTIEQARAFNREANIGQLAIAHHAPGRDDEALRRLETEFQAAGLFFAREGQSLTLG